MSNIINNLEKLQEFELEIIKTELDKDTTLLLSAPKESLEILDKIGLDYKLKIDTKIEGNKKALTFYNKNFGETFNGKSIKTLCDLYDLKIIRASQFKGNIDYSELGSAVKSFCDKNNIIPNYSKFYVLGPREYFDENINSNLECVLFYCDDARGTVELESRLTKVISWGDKLPIYRIYKNLFFNYTYDRDQIKSYQTSIIILAMYLISYFTGIFLNHFGGVFFGVIGTFLLLLNSLTKKDQYKLWNQE